jgi:hypothetical protein
MLNEFDVVKDRNGVLGIVLDADNNEQLDTGVLFTDVDEDNGLWWVNHNRLRKVEQGSRDYNRFMIWYKKYQGQFN